MTENMIFSPFFTLEDRVAGGCAALCPIVLLLLYCVYVGWRSDAPVGVGLGVGIKRRRRLLTAETVERRPDPQHRRGSSDALSSFLARLEPDSGRDMLPPQPPH